MPLTNPQTEQTTLKYTFIMNVVVLWSFGKIDVTVKVLAVASHPLTIDT